MGKYVWVSAIIFVVAIAALVFVQTANHRREAAQPTASASVSGTSASSVIVAASASSSSTIARGEETNSLEGPIVLAGELPLKIERKAGHHENAYLRVRGEWVNLTNFRGPEIIEDAKASPDEQWAYVWHKERPPLQLSIYELKTRRLMCQFAPGYGGGLSWTTANTILHWWGTGSDSRAWRAYDTRGKQIWEGMTCGLEFSPDGRYLATFGTLEAAHEPLRFHDLATLREVYNSKGKADFSLLEYGDRCFNWCKPGTVLVTYHDSQDQKKTMTLNLPQVSEKSLLAPHDVVLRRFIKKVEGQHNWCVGFSLTLPQGRFVSPTAEKSLNIIEEKYKEDLKDRLTVTVENDGKTLALRFKPGEENIGTGNEITVTAQPEAMKDMPRELSTAARWTVEMDPQ